MGNALFVDISSWQKPALINWSAYKAWSAEGDGISRILLRDDQGVGVKDSAFEQCWAGATGAGVEQIFVYHYAYPNLHPGAAGATAEAESMQQIVGARLRKNDRVMLDLEQNESSAWALAFGTQLKSWHPTANKPVLYDSLAHIQQFLTASALPQLFDLALAKWTNDPNSRPAAPPPWPRYAWLQYTDAAQVPGMPGKVDANVFLGGERVDYRVQQAKTIWASTPYDPATGIYGAWLNAYLLDIVCGPPIGPEISTVDWHGQPIQCQYFGSGVRIEYYASPAPGIPAGSHHGYTATSKLW